MTRSKPKCGPALNKQSDRGFAIKLMEHLVVPTFVLSPDCRVLIWNRACERLTGIPAAEVVGTSEHWRGFYDAPRPCLADLVALGRVREVDQLYAQHGATDAIHHGLSAENWCVMPQLGTSLYLAIDAGPIYDDAGRLIAVVETLRDMTAQKEAQVALQALASRDGLTGLANRRSFDENLDQEWRRAAREAHPLSLLMIDIDFFKRYNDAYGHQQGDECLKGVAHILSTEMLRASDHAARYGGEEFAVVLPNTTLEGARRVAEHLRQVLAENHLAHVDSPIADHVTISVGVATAEPPLGENQSSLMAAADAALYRAKMLGRDRVVIGRDRSVAAAANCKSLKRSA
ncbi:diguanylate cyclase (GGDEF) domain-containing protein [Rhizobiales bacterium GAS188]|nr:diguanylate cyclase (GGDEF) domain-containing protein [Rhizobiales bacterium GAS188]